MKRLWGILLGAFLLSGCTQEDLVQSDIRIFQPELGSIENQLIQALKEDDFTVWELELPVGHAYFIQLTKEVYEHGNLLESQLLFGTNTQLIQSDSRTLLFLTIDSDGVGMIGIIQDVDYHHEVVFPKGEMSNTGAVFRLIETTIPKDTDLIIHAFAYNENGFVSDPTSVTENEQSTLLKLRITKK